MIAVNRIINGRYRIDEEIGRGGLGTVYKAYDLYLDQIVAIKILNSNDLARDVCRSLFSEILIVNKLDHPNIIKIVDAGEVESTAYIVMEYIDGASLHEAPPGNEEELLDFAVCICDALVEAHSHGVIHRDLKPENIIRKEDGTIKLTDFGLASMISRKSDHYGLLEGTVFYIAPEQALENEIDGRADLYSLGIMLYEFLYGVLPFTDDDPVAIIAAHLNQNPIFPEEKNSVISNKLKGIIRKLLKKDPGNRFQSAELLKAELANIITK